MPPSVLLYVNYTMQLSLLAYTVATYFYLHDIVFHHINEIQPKIHYEKHGNGADDRKTHLP